MSSEEKEKLYQDFALKAVQAIDSMLPNNVKDEDKIYISGIVTATFFARFLHVLRKASGRAVNETTLMVLIAGHSSTIAGYVQSLLDDLAKVDPP